VILLRNVVAQWQKRQVVIFFLTVLHKCNVSHRVVQMRERKLAPFSSGKTTKCRLRLPQIQP
jgi:hypothetical protein